MLHWCRFWPLRNARKGKIHTKIASKLLNRDATKDKAPLLCQRNKPSGWSLVSIPDPLPCQTFPILNNFSIVRAPLSMCIMRVELSGRLYTLLAVKEINFNMFPHRGHITSTAGVLIYGTHAFAARLGIFAFWIIVSMSSRS